MSPVPGPEEKRSRASGGWMPGIQKRIFPRRSFCRHPYFTSSRPRRHGLARSRFHYWGGGKRHPGFLRAFSIKLGGKGGSPHSSLKTSVLKALLSPPSLSGGLSRGIREGAADTTGVAVKTGGPKHSRATSDGSEGPREGQGRPGTGGE